MKITQLLLRAAVQPPRSAPVTGPWHPPMGRSRRHAAGGRASPGLSRALPLHRVQAGLCRALPCRGFFGGWQQDGAVPTSSGMEVPASGLPFPWRTRAAGMLFHVPFSKDVPSAAPSCSTLHPNPPARPPARGGGCVFSLLQASRGAPAVPARARSPLRVDIQAPVLAAGTTACAFHREYLYHFA